MNEPPPSHFWENVREWFGVGGGVATILVLGRPVWDRLFPIRITGLEPAHILTRPGSLDSRNEVLVVSRIETLKRSSGLISRISAYVEGMEMASLSANNFRQPEMGLDEQTVEWGTLPDGNYVGRNLVIVVEWRVRKGRFAIKKAIRIK